MNNKMTWAHVYEKAEVNTYAHIHHANWTLTEKIKKREGGWGNLSMCSIVFSAFTIEAYCNHIGRQKIADWEKHERDSIKEKINLIASTFSVAINWGCEPWQTVGRAIKFRNLMAHGRSEEVEHAGGMVISDLAKFETEPLAETEWQKILGGNDTAVKTREAVKDAINIINIAAGLGECTFRFGIRTRHTSPIT